MKNLTDVSIKELREMKKDLEYAFNVNPDPRFIDGLDAIRFERSRRRKIRKLKSQIRDLESIAA